MTAVHWASLVFFVLLPGLAVYVEMRASAMSALNQDELDGNIAYAATVEEWMNDIPNDDEAKDIVALVYSHFKYGYGGHNGWFKDRTGLLAELNKQYLSAREEVKKLKAALSYYESFLLPLSILQPDTGIDIILDKAKEIMR